jgi:hypothetical protein
MWPAALTYVLASDEQRKTLNSTRHTQRVVRSRGRRRGRRSSPIDL